MLMKRTRFWLIITIVAAPLSLSLACNKSGGLKTFQFETVTLDAKGKVTNRRTLQAKSYTEDSGGVHLEMVLIPAGTFQMGSPGTEENRLDQEGPQHQVSVTAFNIGKYEVTQAQWRAVAKSPKVKIDLRPDLSHFKGDDLPVELVSWEAAQEFCARLSKATRREYRLPSEAEWEYAARAGTQTPFALGETITPEFVNYDELKTTAVGSLGVANGFGLYDIDGNVGEWVGDYWHDNYDGAPTDGSAWLSGGEQEYRVFRGGSWYGDAVGCRSAYRHKNTPSYSYYNVGFRVVAVARQ